MALKHRREFAGSSTLQGSSSTPTRSETDNLIDHSGSQAANGSRRHRSQSASENLDILVNHVLIHRSPPTVTRSLRYLLAQGELPHRLSLTSSLFGEGVTAMSRSLASLIAYDWRESTCWVDLNWWKVGATDPATSPFEVTIADVLEGAGTVADLPVATSIPALSMVGAGEVPPGSRPGCREAMRWPTSSMSWLARSTTWCSISRRCWPAATRSHSAGSARGTCWWCNNAPRPRRRFAQRCRR